MFTSFFGDKRVVMFDQFSWIRRLSQAGTLLYTTMAGIKVGEDSFGNQYFRSRKEADPRKGRTQKRWVLYAGEPEATKVPPEWFAWLHYTAENPLPSVCDQPLPNVSFNRYVWQKPHLPNLTGSEAASIPPGYGLNLMVQGQGDKTSPTYKAWTPEHDLSIREPY